MALESPFENDAREAEGSIEGTEAQEGLSRRLVIDLKQEDDRLLACSTGGLAEVVALPEILPVPRTKGWFLGLCSHQGHLATVNDLGDFLLGAPTETGPNCRVLLFEHTHFLYGFLVPAVIGFRNFIDDGPDENLAISQGGRMDLKTIQPVDGAVASVLAGTEGKEFLALDAMRIISSRKFNSPGLG